MHSFISSVSEGRAVYVLYFSTSFTIHAVVVNPFRNKEISTSFLEKQFRDACQALGSVPGNLTFHVWAISCYWMHKFYHAVITIWLFDSLFRWTTKQQLMQVANMCKECYLITGVSSRCFLRTLLVVASFLWAMSTLLNYFALLAHNEKCQIDSSVFDFLSSSINLMLNLQI
jgi:hypothetical protein